MDHIYNIDESLNTKLEKLFSDISCGNVILFLGAGTSVNDENRFLGGDIINLYEEYINESYGVTDLVKFVDILSAKKNFDRVDFDNFIFELLTKLEPQGLHKIIAAHPWRKIITTNQDLLIERAFDSIRNSPEHLIDLKYIREKQEFGYTTAANETKYIKLNGCASDRKRYPFVYSSNDFKRASPFYKLVLNDLKGVSDKISFISIGYSFKDPFSTLLLDKFDSYDYRRKRILYNVDPFVSESHLDYFSKNRICIINLSANEFLTKLAKWGEDNAESILRNRRISYYHADNSKIKLPPKLTLKLSGSLNQLNERLRNSPSDKVEFYKGEEPTYTTIMKDYDVIRDVLIKRFIPEIIDYTNNNESHSVPIIFLKGEYGSGKSTIAYRLLFEIQKELTSTLIFEVTDHTKLNTADLLELFNYAKAEYYIFFFNYIERDSVFKALLEFRNALHIEQNVSPKFIILSSIRENILERYKYSKTIKNELELEVTSKLNDEEISLLLDNLQDVGLKNFRDEREKSKIVEMIKNKYASDTFITMLELTPGTHYLDLLESYDQLPEVARNALLFIASLHQFNILMPVGLLKNLISKDWEAFRNNFLLIDCKNIILQVEDNSYSSAVDLYFKTKHPLIAKVLIKRIVPNKDDLFSLYMKIINSLFVNEINSRVVNDLLKSLRIEETFNLNKINLLFDACYVNMSEDPYFLLLYSNNLQHRSTLEALKKAIRLIIYAESFFIKRNHRFTHRRAVLNFQIAKLLYEQYEKKELSETYQYISEAESLFQIKLILDPSSSYSFFDYIIFIMWKLQKIEHPFEEELRRRVQILELFDLAEKTVFDNIERILSLKRKFIRNFQTTVSSSEYESKLLTYYENAKFRPMALILLYHFYEQNSRFEKLDKIISELEDYTSYEDVGKFLFKYYGRNLNYTNIRLKFYDLIAKHKKLESAEPLRFNYFMFVADCYNQYVSKAYSYLDKVKYNFKNLNPDYKFNWKENDSDEIRKFEGVIIKNKRNNFKVQIPVLQQSFYPEKFSSNKMELGLNVKCLLNFYLVGIRAKIIVEE